MKLLNYFLTSILLLPLSVIGAESRPDMSFSFEKGCGCDFPVKLPGGKGRTAVRPHLGSRVIDKNQLLVPGLDGSGLHIGSRNGQGHDSISFYRKEGLVPAQQGSISFWVRPDDWDISNRKNVGYIRLRAATGETLAVVSKNIPGQARIACWYGFINKPGTPAVRAVSPVWEKGVWRHVAVTWGKGQMAIYLDGKMASARAFKPAGKDFDRLTLGADWGHWSPGSSTLDDVRFFHRKLSGDEVRAEYKRLAGSTPESRCVELALGKRTVRIDGRIEPGEYAAGFSLMRLYGKHIEPGLADRQTAVYFSRDAENLYFGTVSVGENLKSSIKNRDGSIWEDDSIDLYLTSGGKNAPIYHFIANAAGTVYDAVVRNGTEDRSWNCKVLRSKSFCDGNIWTFEAALPLKEIGFSPEDGNSFYFNVCRTFVGVRAVAEDYSYDRAAAAVSTSVSPGAFRDRRFYGRAFFNAGAPAFAYAPLGNIFKRSINSRVSVSASGDDVVTLSASVSGKPAFRVEQSRDVRPGKGEEFLLKGEVPREGEFITSLKSQKHGTLFRAKIPYFESTPLIYHSMFTRLAQKQLVFVAECRNAGGAECTVSLRMSDWKSGKEVFKAEQPVTTSRGRNHIPFDISKLPEGVFRVHYELRDAGGKTFARDTEYYANYAENPPWHKTQAGAEDVVPVPWTAPEFEQKGFKCWGRHHKFGGGGVLSSLESSGRELLSRPVRLILNGKSVDFSAGLLKAGKGYADYLLLPVDRTLPLKIKVRAEFDGFMWFDLILGKGLKANSLRLETAIDRRHVVAIDDNSSANVKHDITSWKNKSYSLDPAVHPFYWIGGAERGLMGGVENCRGWYCRNKKRGLVYTVTPDEVVTVLNMVDTPLTVAEERRIGFYLSGTPVKPKNLFAATLRDRKTMWVWSGYITNFYEHKWPGMMLDERYHYMNLKRNVRMFWYNSSKGASPVSPWWNRYGIDWNMAGDPGRMQQDMSVATRTLRDRNLWAWTCQNSRSFMEYKLYCVNWFLNSRDYSRSRDLYFDLAWPRACSNTEHGCIWRDEFGYVHKSYDLKNLREFHKRVYIAMKKKDPTALMLGHETFYRVPSDNFFDLILGGETYERQIARTHNYYDILSPEVMRILCGLRTNEVTYLMSAQIVRTMQMYSPQLFKKLTAVSPSIMEKEHRHFLAYAGTHNIFCTVFASDYDILGPIIADVYESLGSGRRFHSYWQPGSGIAPVVKHGRFIYGAHSGAGRLLIILLNDTDKEMTNGVEIDPAVIPIPSTEGKDVFSGGKFRMKGRRLEIKLPPRESRFILFENRK